MKHERPLVFLSLRLIALLVSLACMPVHADDYSDVSQLVRAGKLPEALSKADQFLSAQPKDPQMRFIKGVIQRDSGKINEAISTFTRLSEDYPELPEPYNNLAVLYAGQSQFDKARTALEMAIRTNPSYATAHENLGDIYAKLASQAYNKALQLDNTNQAAVAPKLALIREIFSPNGAPKTQRPAPATPIAPAALSAPTTPNTQPVASLSAPAKPATAVAAPVVPAPAAPAAKAPMATALPAAQPVTVVAANDNGGQTKEVEAAVASWAKLWSARDVKGYLAAYGKEFDPPGSMGRKAWEEERTQRIASKASISVKVDNLSVHLNGNRATAKFRQDYKAGGLAVTSHKVLELSKVDDHWQILKESVGN
jgi:tetratricopeptide (TPR) repeat protein